MSEPKKFNCESARPDDYICTEVSVLLDKMRVSILQEGREQWVMLKAENARAFAAEILRIADEIEQPKKAETMSTKKPIEFKTRDIVSVEFSVVGPNLSIGEYFFGVGDLPALRKALDDYEAAVKKANTLTLGDLEDGGWFQFADVQGGQCRVSALKRGNDKRWVTFTNGLAADFCSTDVPVIRLKATFEVVE